MQNIILIGLAGALGAISRYGLSNVVHKILGDNFAFGTLAVNVIGCLLLGFIMHISINTDIIEEKWRLALTVGFLGALTTFSTFSYETVRFIEDGLWRMVLYNIAGNVVVGILAAIAGISLGRILFGGTS